LAAEPCDGMLWQALSRKHVIEVGASGLITITGGKWTTYRRMAEDTVNEAQKQMKVQDPQPCKTRGMQLVGSDRAGVVCDGKFNSILVALKNDYGLAHDVAKHLVGNYGTRALQIAEIVRQNKYGVAPPSSSKAASFAKRLSPRYQPPPPLAANVLGAFHRALRQPAQQRFVRFSHAPTGTHTWRPRLSLPASKSTQDLRLMLLPGGRGSLLWMLRRRGKQRLEL